MRGSQGLTDDNMMIKMYLTPKTTAVSSLAPLSKVLPQTYFNSRQSFAGVSAGGSKDATRWSSFTLIAKSHATLLRLLHHHHLRLFQEALQMFCPRLRRMKTLGCYRCLSPSLRRPFVASYGMHWCHPSSFRGWGLVKDERSLWKERCKLNFCIWRNLIALLLTKVVLGGCWNIAIQLLSHYTVTKMSWKVASFMPYC